MGFDTNGFNDFIRDNFSYDGATQRIISNIIEYGINHLDHYDGQLVNFIQSVIDDPTLDEIKQFENKEGKAFTVVNFSVVSKDNEGNKHYTNCSAYGEKGDIPKGFKQGDFVKLFGQIRKSLDENGKEDTNVKRLSSKLLKAKEQMKNQEAKKDSVLGEIKKYKDEEKVKQQKRKKLPKKQRDKEMSVQSSGCTDYFIAVISTRKRN